MTFDWEDFLRLAEELQQGADTSPIREARLRAAISRAYYAAHCRARNRLLQRVPGSVSRTAGAHYDVADAFKRQSSRHARKVGENLHRLFAHRKKADYDDTFPAIEACTKAALRFANEVVGTLPLI